MTPQPSIPDERPDPVKALEGVNVWPVTLERLRNAGYVLVNADMLAEALNRAWVRSNDASELPRPPDLAGHLFAALEKQP